MNRFTTALKIRALSSSEVKALGGGVALYELLEDLVYESDLFGVLTAPAGMLTDFASIPKGALWFINDDSPGILFGSVIHDMIYSAQGKLPGGVELSRVQADAVLAEAMKVCGANAGQIFAVHSAVRLGGGSHWKA